MSDFRNPISVGESVVKIVRYDELDAFKLAYRVALDIHKGTLEWPKIEQFGGIADQLRRSSKSICANMAEGLSKKLSSPDERKFLSIALGSCEESKLWMRFARDLGYVDETSAKDWDDALSRVAQMVQGLKRKAAA